MRIKYEQPSVCHQSYKSVLGQRPIWDWRHDKLLWVDIYENKIIETDQDNNIIDSTYFSKLLSSLEINDPFTKQLI